MFQNIIFFFKRLICSAVCRSPKHTTTCTYTDTYAVVANSFVEWWWDRLGVILSDAWPLESLNATHQLKPPVLNSNPPVTSQACPCSDTLSSVSFSAISFSLDLRHSPSRFTICVLYYLLIDIHYRALSQTPWATTRHRLSTKVSELQWNRGYHAVLYQLS